MSNIQVVKGFGLFAPPVVENIKSIHNYINEAGWNPIGHGFYSTVFSKTDSKYVIKVFDKNRDPGAYSWLLFSYLYGETSPHFVKIHALFEVALEEREFSEKPVVVVMEKLLENEKKVRKISRALRGYDRDWEGTALFRGYVNHIASLIGSSNDCHQGNVMFRACGTWVLTDPLAGGDSSINPGDMEAVKQYVDRAPPAKQARV